MYQIFVVEDELLIRQSIREMVEGLGSPYVFCGEAADGEIALSMMQDLMPDIVLTDIKMPFLDGFGLIKHAKAIIPWLKTIIISGYDEFESAQKAISLGVDLYLLKPVRGADLAEAIHTVAAQLDQQRSGALISGYNKDEVQHALHQHFMQQLLGGGAGTAQLLERAAALELDIVHPLYQVALFHFESGAGLQLRGRIGGILGGERSALHYFDGADRLALLVFGKAPGQLSEATYRLINIIRHDEGSGAPITTVVSAQVGRLSAVKDIYAAASAMLSVTQTVSSGAVIDMNDTAQITADLMSMGSTFGELYGQRLIYAGPDDVAKIVSDYLGGEDPGKFNSAMYRYYALVDILRTCVTIVSAAKPDLDKKDIAAKFGSAHDIFQMAGRRDTFEVGALALMDEAVAMKQQNLGLIRHSHVISKAEAYIADNFCDPNISLISVSRHVGMSAAHFSTVFSQTVGKTFISYLTAMRIRRAKELLASTDMKLAAIAMEIGYNEPNYFSHVFKKYEDITPKDYRSLMQGQSASSFRA